MEEAVGAQRGQVIARGHTALPSDSKMNAPNSYLIQTSPPLSDDI